MKDNVIATGKLSITLRDEHGNVKEHRDMKNLVVNIGKEFIASRMASATMSPITHMAVGTNIVTPLPSDVSLGTENARVVLDSSGVLSRTLTYFATFPAGTGTGMLTEAGLFNASSSGTMLARTTFDVFNKLATDSLTIEWDVTIN